MIIKPGKFDYGWTDLKRDKYDLENNEIIKENKSLKILFYGDSITACWPMKDYFSKEVNILNRAIGGDRTRYMLYRFDADCVQLFPEKIVFLGGINDIRAWSKREDYFVNMNEVNIVEEVTDNIVSMARKAKANNIKFMISSILPTDEIDFDNELINQKISEINEILEEYCLREELIFIDYHERLIVGENQRIDKIKTIDGLHPNEEGYKIMKEVLFKKIGDNNDI